MNRKFQKECESSCEYILPDYLGDIKRVLTSSAKIIPSGRFNQEGIVECAGVVAHELVYLDSENKPSAASFTSDYDFTFPIDPEIYKDAYVSPSLVFSSARLAGPRRIIAKAGILSDIYLSENKSPAVGGSAFDAAVEVEMIEKSISQAEMLASDGTEREYAEEIAVLDEVAGDEIEIITSNAFVRITESTPVDGGVNIKGVLVINAIVKTPEMSTFAIRREIPFDETVSIEGVNPEMSVIADAAVSSLVCSAVNDEGKKRINADIILECKAAAFFNEGEKLIKDAYVKSRDSENSYETYTWREHLYAGTESRDISLKLSRKELGMENIKDVSSLSCDFKSLVCQADGYLCKISADAVFSGIACEINEDGNENLIPIKFTSSVAVNANLGCQIPEDAICSAKLYPASCEINIDSENLYISASPTAVIAISRECAETALSACNIVGDTRYEGRSSKISVYYPEKGESLFEIAKKFHTTSLEIAKDNKLADAVSVGGAPLELATGFDKLIIR